MIDNEAYRATLERLEHDLQLAEVHANNLRAAITAIRGLIEVATPSPATVNTTRKIAPIVERDPRLATATMEAAAMIALDKSKQPMRVREIFDLLIAMGYKYPKGFEVFKGSMTPTLDRRPQFAKVGKGLYTLKELVHTNGTTPQTVGTVVREYIA